MILQVVLWILTFRPETGLASRFGYPGDPNAGGKAICIHRRIRLTDTGVAHRYLPCGTRVLVYCPRTGRSIIAPVVDHGPYGAVDGGRWVLKTRRRDPGRWRGILDLTPAASAALGHDGLEPVIIWRLP